MIRRQHVIDPAVSMSPRRPLRPFTQGLEWLNDVPGGVVCCRWDQRPAVSSSSEATAGRTKGRYMLRSLYIMLDYHIAANDGEVGRVGTFSSTMKAGPSTTLLFKPKAHLGRGMY